MEFRIVAEKVKKFYTTYETKKQIQKKLPLHVQLYVFLYVRFCTQ